MAAPAVSLFPAFHSLVPVGGQPVTIAYGPIQFCLITNPATPGDQGIDIVEPLFVDIVGAAGLNESPTTMALQAGQSFSSVVGQTSNVSVNAKTTGHRFSAIIIQASTPFPPPPPIGPFPPSGPTTLTKTIPSYLYNEYSDDDNLQAFVTAYNQLVQEYVNWFVEIGLPIYTGDMIVGPLLDWVATGLYGYSRPSLASGLTEVIGPYNTFVFNEIAINSDKQIGPSNIFVTTDDIYKRCLTWHFYKGDGKVFNIRWLKRRLQRFLIGIDGTAPNVDQTYQISVTFGNDNQVNINLLQGIRVITSSSIYNGFEYNTEPFNAIASEYIEYTPIADAGILQAAIDSGALELPFQYTYEVSISPSA